MLDLAVAHTPICCSVVVVFYFYLNVMLTKNQVFFFIHSLWIMDCALMRGCVWIVFVDFVGESFICWVVGFVSITG